ncbi:MAG: beta-N-acetylhexosaminidase [Pseudomonadota bacterium]
MSSAPKAFITGVSGLALTDDEKAFLRTHRPWGLIVFARNVESPRQLSLLTAEFRDCVDSENAPVFVDQEGGRVQRLRAPHWGDFPAALTVSKLEGVEPGLGQKAARMMGEIIAGELRGSGITVNCAPVLDVPIEGASNVIGDRAWGGDVDRISAMAGAFVDGQTAGGVAGVMKHIPGHGRAMVDSHKELPVVTAPREQIIETDMAPFRNFLSIPMAMTAHVVYTALDPKNPATTSKTVIEDIIRGELGYEGLIMTDDLSMGALSGDFADRAKASFAAGCDVVLHCNGVMEEMVAVANACHTVTRELQTTDAKLAELSGVVATDLPQKRLAFADLMARLPAA